MGNFIEITYTGTDAILTAGQIKLLKSLLKSNDGVGKDFQLSVKKVGKNYKLDTAYADGSHGAFKQLADDKIIKKLTPLSGKIHILYHDIDAPQILQETVRSKK